jgi:hypothetical protein
MINLSLLDYCQECSGGCQDQLSTPDDAAVIRGSSNIGHSTGQYIDRSGLGSEAFQGAEIASHGRWSLKEKHRCIFIERQKHQMVQGMVPLCSPKLVETSITNGGEVKTIYMLERDDCVYIHSIERE